MAAWAWAEWAWGPGGPARGSDRLGKPDLRLLLVLGQRLGGDPAAFVQADDPFTDALKNFKGLAVTVRFDDGALEVESAGDVTGIGFGLSALYASDRGADVMETLPDDTALAMGAGFEPGWLTALAEQAASFTGGDMTADELLQEASDVTGLDLPADLETLVVSPRPWPWEASSTSRT